jgi:hypothetical protein
MVFQQMHQIYQGTYRPTRLVSRVEVVVEDEDFGFVQWGIGFI